MHASKAENNFSFSPCRLPPSCLLNSERRCCVNINIGGELARSIISRIKQQLAHSWHGRRPVLVYVSIFSPAATAIEQAELLLGRKIKLKLLRIYCTSVRSKRPRCAHMISSTRRRMYHTAVCWWLQLVFSFQFVCLF